MAALASITMVLILLSAVLIIGVILLQPSKGDMMASMGGLSSQFGQVFGMQKSKDLLKQITRILLIIIFALSLITNRFFIGGKAAQEVKTVKPLMEGAPIPKTLQNSPAPTQAPPQQ
jgi:protein translocase SecG subunit